MKKKAQKNKNNSKSKSTPKKKLGIGSTVFSFTPTNNIDLAWQQTRVWGSLLHFSESGRGRWAHSYYLLSLRPNIVCLCLVERTGERVGRGVLVVNVASGVNIHVMDILL